MKINYEKNVVCHISGITPSFRDGIYNKFKDNGEIEIVDLDKKGEDIRVHNKMEYLYNQFRIFKSKNNEKYKSIEKEMDLFWYNNLNDFIMDTIKYNREKRIIFIGDNNHFRHLSKKVEIPCGNRFYLSVNEREYCLEMVKGYLNNYYEDIINNEFPLNFLDHKYIIEKRKRVNKMFNSWGYLDKNDDDIMEFLDLSLNEKKMELLDYVYYGSKMPYYSGSEIHPDKGKNLMGYSNAWDAIFSLVPKSSKIEYGVKEGVPYIEEKVLGGFNKLKFKGYLYRLDTGTFIPNSKKDGNKFKSSLPAKILKKEKFYSITSICRKHNIDVKKI